MSANLSMSIKRIDSMSEARAICRIYQKAYGGNLDPNDIVRYASEAHHDVHICCSGSAVIAYCVTEVEYKHQNILDIAADPEYLDTGASAALIRYVSTCLPFKVTRTTVKETEDYTIRLLASVGFKAISVCRDKYPDGRDGYVMEYSRPIDRSVDL